MGRPRPAALFLLALLAGLGAGGCGLQAGKGTTGVRLNVTRDFGAQPVAEVAVAASHSPLTPLKLLEREARVQVSAGRVESIDGARAGAGQTWSLYVNGIGTDYAFKPTDGSSPPVVHAGDQLWWDLHPAQASKLAPAVVGDFPQPFQRGSGGKRFPTTLECAPGMTAVCTRVAQALAATGTRAAPQELGTGSGQATIGVLVGTWSQLRGTLVAALLDSGPASSGVYARFSAGGERLELLGPDGRPVRALGPGAGLVAAVRDASAAPTWLLTGTDLAGVKAAAAALSESALRLRYAVAVLGTSRLALPLR